MKNYYKGIYAEKLTALLLILKGYKILETRFKTKIGEIDLICSKNKQIIFVEVKSRKDKQVFFDVINRKQQTRIKNAATLYLKKHRMSSHDVRFDVIFVSFPSYWKHIENAFY